MKVICKPKKCRSCHEQYQPMNSLQTVCSPKCAIQQLEVQKDKLAKRDAKVARKAMRERKQALKSRSKWLAEAQAVFNKFIRLRDEHIGVCISCQKPPKKKNAGHYKSRGAFPELRFNEDNCHLQCEACNTYLSGNQINYRLNLVNKIGLDRVEALESYSGSLKLTIDEIKELKAKYQAKVRQHERQA